MEYKIKDVDKIFEGKISEFLGNNEYVIKINDHQHQMKILKMDSKGIEFLLDQKYHKARYLESSTNEMEVIIDNTLLSLNMHTNLDLIVFKNTGGGSSVNAQLTLKSQIPGKVVSIAIGEGDAVKEGDVICTLESMKMQVSVKSHKDGIVKSIKVKVGGTVAKNDPIAEIE
jgi:biotin carboxyl carrier protein